MIDAGIRVQRTRISRVTAVHASHKVIVLEQSAFGYGGATLLNFAPKPLDVVHRATTDPR